MEIFFVSNGFRFRFRAGTEVALPDGQTVSMAAKVGLLTRNIRIVGDSYDDVIDESFGARVLASSYYEQGTDVKKTGGSAVFRPSSRLRLLHSIHTQGALSLQPVSSRDVTCSLLFIHLYHIRHYQR